MLGTVHDLGGIINSVAVLSLSALCDRSVSSCCCCCVIDPLVAAAVVVAAVGCLAPTGVCSNSTADTDCLLRIQCPNHMPRDTSCRYGWHNQDPYVRVRVKHLVDNCVAPAA